MIMILTTRRVGEVLVEVTVSSPSRVTTAAAGTGEAFSTLSLSSSSPNLVIILSILSISKTSSSSSSSSPVRKYFYFPKMCFPWVFSFLCRIHCHLSIQPKVPGFWFLLKTLFLQFHFLLKLAPNLAIPHSLDTIWVLWKLHCLSSSFRTFSIFLKHFLTISRSLDTICENYIGLSIS